MRFVIGACLSLLALSLAMGLYSTTALPLEERRSVVHWDGGAPIGPIARFAPSDSLAVKSCGAACGDLIRATPEPAALLLFGLSLAGIGLILRRRLHRARPVDRP